MSEDKKIEISTETLRGLYLILSGISNRHDSAQVYSKAKPLMEEAHYLILKLGKEYNFDCRGGDL